jgi:hypothetical protein
MDPDANDSMTWTSFLQGVYDSPVGTGIRESGTLFPWIESIHVLMATTVVGSIAIVDLRLVGYASHRKGARQLIIELLPFTWVAFALAATTGLLLFSSNAVSYASNVPFVCKMIALVLAGINMAIFHLTAYQRVGQWNDALPPPRGVRLAGATSLSLWLVIVFLGRWIGFTVE